MKKVSYRFYLKHPMFGIILMLMTPLIIPPFYLCSQKKKKARHFRFLFFLVKKMEKSGGERVEIDLDRTECGVIRSIDMHFVTNSAIYYCTSRNPPSMPKGSMYQILLDCH